MRSSSRMPSMISVNGASFGRFGGWRRRYPGGSECNSILATELARSFPSAQTLTMTHQSHSSIKIHSVHPPPAIRSILTKAIDGPILVRRRNRTNRPLHWGIIAPPFSPQPHDGAHHGLQAVPVGQQEVAPPGRLAPHRRHHSRRQIQAQTEKS